MEILGSTKSKISKYENGKNVPPLKITEVVSLQFKFVNSDYQQNVRVL